ncbi:MAG: SDR family oxidoreductase [Opitutales bacterium]
MKLVVTGASGFLGREVCLAALRRGHEVLALGGSRAPTIPGVKQARAFDLCSEAALEALILEEFPHAVVHCAALPTIETCLAEPAKAKALNAEVPKKLAQLCFHLGAKLVHLSTDTVFDGVAGNYQPTDKPAPLNLYGETKAAAEVEVLRYGREHAAVLRTSPIIGNSVTGDRGLQERLFASWKEGRPSSLFTDEIRQPVEVSNLADVTIELCERPNLSGLFHWAGTEAMSRHEIGLRIARHFGLDAETLVRPLSRADVPAAAARPRDLSLRLHPLAGKLRTQAQSFDEQLAPLRVPRGCEEWYEKETGRKVVRRLEKGIDF